MSLAKWVPSHFSPTSLASSIAAVHKNARKQCRLLAKQKEHFFRSVLFVYAFVPKTGFEPACP
jgi:hypothetical protein